MDLLSIFGLLCGIAAVLAGQLLEGGQFKSLLNAPAFLIVFGGSLGAILLETPWKIFKSAIYILHWLVFPPRHNLDEEIDKIIMWSHVARKQGLLGLEAVAENEYDKFAKKGLMLLVDGSDPKYLKNILELDWESELEVYDEAVKVYESFGGYTPTLGILGAVLGLIQVMHNLADPSKLGHGIAVAFIATIYGVAFANLFFLPTAKKLQHILVQKNHLTTMVIEGLVAIAEGENPRLIKIKLHGYLK